MYFRATEVSKGSGLGLFIVKETINKIGGKVAVQSTLGLGSTFEITIPEMVLVD
jgi:signal transduction histidine kinase